MARDPGDEGDERRLIDVSETEVLRAGEIIEFIAENSVTPGGGQMEKDLRQREGQDDRRPERRGKAAASRPQVNSPFHRFVTSRARG